jgi:phage baseplate assembly protein W
MDVDITSAARVPVIFGATGIEEIQQNIRFILATMVFSVPLDRSFGGNGLFLDAPSPFEAQRRMAAIIDIVERHEPRVRVTGLRFDDPGTAATMDGQLVPVLTYEIREGVEL